MCIPNWSTHFHSFLSMNGGTINKFEIEVLLFLLEGWRKPLLLVSTAWRILSLSDQYTDSKRKGLILWSHILTTGWHLTSPFLQFTVTTSFMRFRKFRILFLSKFLRAISKWKNSPRLWSCYIVIIPPHYGNINNETCYRSIGIETAWSRRDSWPTFYGTRRSITVLTRARLLT
jgi:hypothetical protein